MRKILLVLLVLVGLISEAQVYLPASAGSPVNRAISPAQATPIDSRTCFYDANNFLYRPFQNTAEVLSYLTLPKYRFGFGDICVNTGGTLNGDGTLTGGQNNIYYFRNGTADSNLVLKISTSVYDSTGVAAMINKRVLTVTIAQLRAMTNPSDTVIYYVRDQGKQGNWRYDPSDVSSADNTGTIVVSGSYRFKRIIINDYFNVTWFGATGDGSTDDITAINATLLVAQTANKSVLFTEGNFLIKGQMYIRNVKVSGIPRKSKIIIAQDFVFTEIIAGRSSSCVLNSQFQGSVTSLANEFFIDGLDIEVRLNQGSGDKSVLGIANTKRGNINNCIITINAGLGASLGFIGIDLWSAVKNFSITNCVIDNLNQSNTGGNIWIRNISNAGNLPENDVSDILVENCTLRSAAKDEPLAVYGVRGVTKNVKIVRTSVYGLASIQDRSVLVSVFPLDDGSAGGAYAAINNVLLQNCTFVDSSFSVHVVRFGQAADALQECNYVKIEGCLIRAYLDTATTSYAIRNIKCVGDYNSAINNNIEAIGSPNRITYGISGFDEVFLNSVVGNISNGIANSKQVSYNTVQVPAIGILNCDVITRNNVFSGNHCVIINSASVVYDISNNNLEDTTTSANNSVGIYIQSIASLNPSTYIAENRIKMNYIGNYAVRREGTGGMVLINNTAFGTGTTVILANGGTMATDVRGNSWYGILDAIRSTAYNSVSPIYPLGTEAINGSSDAAIFRKISNNGNSADWLTVNYTDSVQLKLNIADPVYTGVLSSGATSSLHASGAVYKISGNSGREISMLTATSSFNDRNALNFIKARGTITSPTVVASGDQVGFLGFKGYDGTSAQLTGLIQGEVDGAVSSGTVPMAFDFITGTQPGNRTSRLRVSSNGNIGIGTTTPAATALIDMISTTKGFRPPVMTSVQRTAISSPATGLMVFDSDSSALFYKSSSSWIKIGSSNATTDASLLTSGTLADARLSSNVPLINAANTFTDFQTIGTGSAYRGATIYTNYNQQFNIKSNIATSTVLTEDSASVFNIQATDGQKLVRFGVNNGAGFFKVAYSGGANYMTADMGGGSAALYMKASNYIGVSLEYPSGQNGWWIGRNYNDYLDADGSFSISNDISVFGSRRFKIEQNGLVQFGAYAAGFSKFDASGNITSSVIAQSDVTNLVTDLAAKAPLASPTFTGTPSLPTGTIGITQSPADNSAKLSTTAYADAIAALKLNVTNPQVIGTVYTPTIGVNIISSAGAKLDMSATASSANNIGIKIRGTSTASSGVTISQSIVPAYNESGTAGNVASYISPYYQANGSGVHYLARWGTNTASDNAGTHTDKFTVDNAGNVVAVGQLVLGATSIAASAALDITSTAKGFLPPRMTTTQKNAISSPAEGLMVYDLTLHKLCVFTGTVWETVTSL